MSGAAEDLTALTTLRLPARATARRDAADLPALREALLFARESGLPVIVLGAGSNVVFAGDVEALVLRYTATGREVLAEDAESVTLRVAAGEGWHALVRWCLAQGYYGLENLALIPGTVGAAPIQNIGAYGVELAPFVETVHAVCIEDGRELALHRAACDFGYRDSVFKGRLRDAVIITAVDIRLRRTAAPVITYPALREALAASTAPPDPRAVFDAVVALRQARLPDPAITPNAGSFFKNPVVDTATAEALARRYPSMPQFVTDGGRKLAAGWLIEHCGWRGVAGDGVAVHPGHALVLVNRDGDGLALLALAERIRTSVAETFGCQLEIEPRVYGAAP
ncbi:UDP-N-acetylmuramate dehydrogenase [Pseudohaliea rubra]|uniref:UDP-N-acetylenolpyruvoylglucosamine reductase n=1 Tax=Pseudohaliea rubra DSM 19751 TaxID=1265313 RepID=A0A095VQE8_9GAMM|nr:UDP-N-acetylmuramate dehydrogenase [Pseudohaliea rubra]KGE03353.1 UDP-N-acetylenolpyruvoylglucosamine reductase [Pseudohaliea rubra DSM 19751]